MKLDFHARDQYAEILNARHRAGEALTAPELGLLKQSTEIEFSGEKGQGPEFIISTSSPDRDRDVVESSGWNLAAFEKNPVVLWAHDNRDLPIGRAMNMRQTAKQLRSSVEFTPADLNPLGDTVRRMIEQRFLNATSVGFRPLEVEMIEGKDGMIEGFHFTKQELLEWSIVPVPANPEALLRAHEAGIDTQPIKMWCERYLDESVKGLGVNDIERAWNTLRKDGAIHVDLGAPAPAPTAPPAATAPPDDARFAAIDARITELSQILDDAIGSVLAMVPGAEADACVACSAELTAEDTVLIDKTGSTWHTDCAATALAAKDSAEHEIEIEIADEDAPDPELLAFLDGIEED